MRFHTITTLSFLLLLLPATAKELDSDESLRAFMIECRTAIQPGDPADFLMSRYRPRKDLWAQWMIFQDAFHVSPAEKEAARREIRQVCGELRRGRAWPHRERPRLRIPFLTTPPEIDGKIGGEWQKTVRLSATYERDNPVPVAGKAARWFFGWDRETFYAAGEFQAVIPAKIPEKPWEGTCAELFLNPSLTLGVYWELLFPPDRSPLFLMVRDNQYGYRDYPAWRGKTGIRSAICCTPEGFCFEAAIPFRLLPNYQLGNAPEAGQILYLMAVLVDNRRYISPFPLLYDSHNPACFAEVTLTGPDQEDATKSSTQTNPKFPQGGGTVP